MGLLLPPSLGEEGPMPDRAQKGKYTSEPISVIRRCNLQGRKETNQEGKSRCRWHLRREERSTDTKNSGWAGRGKLRLALENMSPGPALVHTFIQPGNQENWSWSSWPLPSFSTTCFSPALCRSYRSTSTKFVTSTTTSPQPPQCRAQLHCQNWGLASSLTSQRAQ